MRPATGRLRLVGALLLALAPGSLTGCSDPAAAPAPPHGGPSGISRSEYCASGRPALRDVVATLRDSGTELTWSPATVSLDVATFRVYRRPGPGRRWSRIDQVRLRPGEPRRYLDRAAPAGPAQYGVIEVGTCGEGPLCSPTGTGLRCATVTSADARGGRTRERRRPVRVGAVRGGGGG